MSKGCSSDPPFFFFPETSEDLPVLILWEWREAIGRVRVSERFLGVVEEGGYEVVKEVGFEWK